MPLRSMGGRSFSGECTAVSDASIKVHANGAIRNILERRRSRARTASAIRCPIKLDLDIVLPAGLQGAAWAVTTGLLRHADQNTGRKNKQASHHHLEGGGDERRVHVMIAHPGDDAEFD
jgi:hypothetical protein